MLRAPMATKLVWAQILRPRVPLVYLDLNHYILLARARKGPAPDGYARLLSASLAASNDGRAVFPLSGEHVQEMWDIKDPRQRRDVADVMHALSGLQYLMGRPEIAQLEIDAGFRAVYGEASEVIPLPLIGPSFARAFGMVGGLRIEDENGQDVTAEARREGGADFEHRLNAANLVMERGMLQGPSDEELADLRSDPEFQPEVAQRSQGSRLDFELALKALLDQDPALRRGRLRDIVSAREVSHEWLDAINKVRGQRTRAGLPVPSLDDEMTFLQVVSAMPHNQVAISLKTRYHRNPAHCWTQNDITDIDALSVAYAYCDVAFADKATRAALKDSPELRCIDTFIPRGPVELAEWLESRPELPGKELWVTGARLAS